jgi:hypothetical protein
MRTWSYISAGVAVGLVTCRYVFRVLTLTLPFLVEGEGKLEGEDATTPDNHASRCFCLGGTAKAMCAVARCSYRLTRRR